MTHESALPGTWAVALVKPFAELDESELVSAAAGGSREAFDVIVERHRRAVYQVCYRFVNNHEDASDLAQDAFVRAWNRSRSVELLPSRSGGRAIELPMLGYVAAGMPIEAVAGNETISVPDSLVSGKRDTYVLRVRGESMIDEQIRDGDWVVVEDRKTADNGEMVIALVDGQDVTLKKFYKESNRIRLQPANPTMQPIYVDPDGIQIQGVVVGVMRKY